MQGFLPDYATFRRACDEGLSVVRPLAAASDAAKDPWNFGSGWPPSYEAFGRMRALLTFHRAMAQHPSRVLEVAAGDAALSARLAAAGCEVVANDLRRDSLEASVRTFSNAARIKTVPGNLFDLDPEELGRFDLVIAGEVIEHVAHTVDFLKQLARFVTPTGRVLVTTPNGAYFRNPLPTHAEIEDFTALEKDQFKPDADGHLFLLTPEELEGLAAQAGLEVERLDVWGAPPLTGVVGLRHFAGPHACRAAYDFEEACLRLPYRLRRKLGSSMLAILRHAPS